MILVGLDPGMTTGWCAYAAIRQTVLCSGEFPDFDVSRECESELRNAEAVVIESLTTAHAGIYPQTVSAARISGLLEGYVRWFIDREPAILIPRLDVKRILQRLVHNEIHVQKDRDVWAALKLLHGGEDCAKKGGPLYGVKSHARAALALCVAWTNRGLLEPVKA